MKAGLAALAAGAMLAACGSDGERAVAPPAAPRTYELDWVEQAPGTGLTFRIDRLDVRRDGWELTASVTNRGPVSYVIQRPHRPGETMFGLVLLRSPTDKELRERTAGFRKAPPFLEPDRIEPAPPRVLAVGSEWRGTLSGTRVLPRGQAVRAIFGRFVRTRGDPGYLLWVTEHAVRLTTEGA